MQPESESQHFNGGLVNPSSKKGFNWKKLMLFVSVAVLAAALSGISVWTYMSNQNDNNSKSLNSLVVTKDKKIVSLQSNVKSLETQVAVKATTPETTQQSVSSGLYESLVNFCKTDNKNVGFATLSNGMTNGKNDQYFGSCSVSPYGAITGGYILTAMYASDKWTQLFGGQAPTSESEAACTKYHIPTQLDTCS